MLTASLALYEETMTTTAPATDQQLVAACLAGEPDALAALVERYQSDVFGVCLRMLRDRDAALELTNSIFFKVYQNLGSYDASRPLRPWLLRIATNEAISELRRRQRERERILPEPDDEGASLIDRLPGGDEPEAAALTGERQSAVRAAVAALPEQYRLLVTLRFFHDLSYAEIAEQTGVPANTVGVQLLRARRLLRQALAGEEKNDDAS